MSSAYRTKLGTPGRTPAAAIARELRAAGYEARAKGPDLVILAPGNPEHMYGVAWGLSAGVGHVHIRTPLPCQEPEPYGAYCHRCGHILHIKEDGTTFH